MDSISPTRLDKIDVVSILHHRVALWEQAKEAPTDSSIAIGDALLDSPMGQESKEKIHLEDIQLENDLKPSSSDSSPEQYGDEQWIQEIIKRYCGSAQNILSLARRLFFEGQVSPFVRHIKVVLSE